MKGEGAKRRYFVGCLKKSRRGAIANPDGPVLRWTRLYGATGTDVDTNEIDSLATNWRIERIAGSIA